MNYTLRNIKKQLCDKSEIIFFFFRMTEKGAFSLLENKDVIKTVLFMTDV